MYKSIKLWTRLDRIKSQSTFKYKQLYFEEYECALHRMLMNENEYNRLNEITYQEINYYLRIDATERSQIITSIKQN